MIDKKKVRIMTNLAIYDKNTGIKDKEKNEMLQFDYVYKSNFWARLSAFFGCLIILVFYAVKLVLVDQVDLFGFDYKGEITKIIYYIVAVLVFYTIVNGILANIEYMKSQKRLQKYYKLLDALDTISMNPKHSKQTETVNSMLVRTTGKDDFNKDYGKRVRSRTDLDYMRQRRMHDSEYDDDDDDIPANKYPDISKKAGTTQQTFTRASAQRVPASYPYSRRVTAQSKTPPQKPATLKSTRLTPNLSVNKGAVKGKDGKFNSD